MTNKYLHSERKIGTSGVPDLATTWRYDQTDVLDGPLTKYGRTPNVVNGGEANIPAGARLTKKHAKQTYLAFKRKLDVS